MLRRDVMRLALTLVPTIRPILTAVQPGTAPPNAAMASVLTGMDVLLRDGSDLLRGKRLGLVTNATGRTRGGQSTIDALHDSDGWRLTALFSPEHGIRGEAEAGQTVDSSMDQQTGLPIYSLYGTATRPTDAMLSDLDVLVYDIQDVGARPYTYLSTLLEVMRAGAQHGMPVVVVDRPNPIGGDRVEGNVLDPAFASFVGSAPIAMRYGMTIGEMGQFFVGVLGIDADLTVVPMEGWQRSIWFDETGLGWINPSPNIRSLSAAAIYPGTVLFEATSLSEGRGTSTPFEWIGAPTIDAGAWADRLNQLGVPGVRFAASDRTPHSARYAGQLCHGVSIEITDRGQLQPMALGVTMLATARSMFGQRVQIAADTFDRLAGTDALRRAIEGGASAEEIVAGWQPGLQAFGAQRERYLLY
jgi:uncharacterized protein YbbC (DUF1343 family)